MLRKALAACLMTVFFLSGCAHHNSHPHGGRMVAEYCPGKDAEVTKTPYQATYVLYHWPKPPCDPPPHKWVPEHEVVEMFVRGLGKRACIGFEKDSDGKLFAVAGDEKIGLEAGRYCWHIHPTTEYTGMKWFAHETGERVVEIVSLPFGLVGGAIALVCLIPMGIAFLVLWPFLLFMG